MNLEKKEYQFKCGVKASQKEATYKTDKQLIKTVLTKLNINTLTDLKESMKVTDLIEKLINEDILLDAIDIILDVESVPEALKSDKYKADWENLTREEIINIANDFFILSPSLSKKLGIGKSGLDSQPE